MRTIMSHLDERFQSLDRIPVNMYNVIPSFKRCISYMPSTFDRTATHANQHHSLCDIRARCAVIHTVRCANAEQQSTQQRSVELGGSHAIANPFHGEHLLQSRGGLKGSSPKQYAMTLTSNSKQAWLKTSQSCA